MKSTTFYKKLAETRDKITWNEGPCGSIRGQCDGHMFCPITAVYYLKTGKYRDVNDAEFIGPGFLELDDHFTEIVIDSADGRYPDSPQTRKRLLEVTGLCPSN